MNGSDCHLIPLGTSPAWYNPGEATSGFLLTDGSTRVLMDCGAGVIARYLEMGDDAVQPLDAIVISHAHLDHIADLVPLKYGMQYGSLRDWQPQLWLPPGVHDHLCHMVGTWNGDADFFASAFDLQEYSPAQPFDVGPFHCSSVEVPHFIESFAVRFEHATGSFAYSSDLGPCPQIVDLVQGVDLFLCEATLGPHHDEQPDNRGHLTGTEAGDIAREAGVRGLLLTHVPVEIGRDDALARAREAYNGPAELAKAGTQYRLASQLAQVS